MKRSKNTSKLFKVIIDHSPDSLYDLIVNNKVCENEKQELDEFRRQQEEL